MDDAQVADTQYHSSGCFHQAYSYDKNYYGYWGKKYGLNVPHIPFTVLLDKQGEIIVADDGKDDDGIDMLIEWFNAELKRDWEKKNHG